MNESDFNLVNYIMFVWKYFYDVDKWIVFIRIVVYD